MLKEYEFAESYIEDGEKILWKGKSDRKASLSMSEILYIVYLVLISVLAVLCGVIAVVKADVSTIILAIFMVVGLFVAAREFLKRHYEIRHTEYVITDRKIIRNRVGKKDILLKNKMTAMHVTFHRNRNITVCFGQEGYFGWRRRDRRRPWRFRQEAFEIVNITDVKGVQEALEKLRS